MARLSPALHQSPSLPGPLSRLSLALAGAALMLAASAVRAEDAASAPALAPVETAIPIPVPMAPAASVVQRASAPARTPALPGPTPLSLGQSWASLTPLQREALAPLSKEWDQLDGARKGKWLEIANRYSSLPPEHQQRLRERMVEWTRMSPTERQKARIGYQHANELRGAEQPSKLQEKWEAYQALPAEKRQRLAERAAEKASERREAPVTNLAKAPIQRAPLAVTATGPTVVQARPGATTVLLTQRAEPAQPAASGAPGRPLRTPREARLDPHTLLPQRDVAGR